MTKRIAFSFLTSALLLATFSLSTMAQMPAPGATPVPETQSSANNQASMQGSALEVFPGIELPNYGAAWIVDSEPEPRLLRVRHSLGKFNRHVSDNVMRSFLGPVLRQVMSMDIEGALSNAQVHTPSPVFYLRQTARDIEEQEDPSRGQSHYAIARLKLDEGHRVVALIPLGRITGSPSLKIDEAESVLENIPNSEWMKIRPAKPLTPGTYAVVLVAGHQIDDNVYDFDVLPAVASK